jgi:UDP-N-acetylmuramyl-tripeptide synthetase
MQVLESPAQAVQWLQQRGCTTLSTDSREVQPGCGFVAWPGAAIDARRFVPAALRQHANACLVEQDGVQALGWTQTDAAHCVGTNLGLQKHAGNIAAEFFKVPSHHLAVVAVTGTNGKTSTAWWLAQALSALTSPWTMPCAVVGTLGVGHPPAVTHGASPAAGSEGLPATGFTTPDPVVLQRTLRKFVDEGLVACAIEASSIGLQEQRMNATRIRVAVFTNFTQDHLDYHASMQAYWAAKAQLFSWPGLESAVINIDDSKGAELAAQLGATALDVWTVSCHGPARLQATNVLHQSQGVRFDVREGDNVVSLQPHVMGGYNVLNLLGVLGAMRALGIPLAQAAQACSNLHPVPGRMECLGGDGQPLVAVDYAHTPDALAQALAALRPLATQRGGKLWCVFGCGGNRDASKRPLMGAIAAQHADQVLVTSDNPRSEKPEAIIAQVLLGAAHSKTVEVQSDRAMAIADVLLRADASDVVLLAGKGHEQWQEVAGAKLPFSDQEQVLLALKARADAPSGAAA